MGKYIAKKIYSNILVTPSQYNIIFAGMCYNKPCDTVKDMTYYKSPLHKVLRAGIVNLFT